MANNLKLSNAAVNAEADALASLLDDGYLRIYGGAQPATSDTAIGAQPLLAELRFSATMEASIVNGVITADAITPEAAAPDTDTATWFRALQSDGTTSVMDGSVGTAGADLNLNSVAINAGAAVSVSSFVHTVVKSV